MNLPIPPITPYLTVADAAAAIAFYKTAMGAVQDGESHTMPGTNKIMHARLLINGSMIMLADDFSGEMGGQCMTPPSLGGSPIVLAMQVDDAQAIWDKVVAAGATVTMELKDQFWGDKYGQFTDPFGHKWSVSQTIKQMTDEEMKQAADEKMQADGTLQA